MKQEGVFGVDTARGCDAGVQCLYTCGVDFKPPIRLVSLVKLVFTQVCALLGGDTDALVVVVEEARGDEACVLEMPVWEEASCVRWVCLSATALWVAYMIIVVPKQPDTDRVDIQITSSCHFRTLINAHVDFRI